MIKLTEEQQKAYDVISNSDDRVIVLLGMSGSGKTTLVTHLAKNFEGDISLTATTNKAKTLLENKTGMKADTIHSFCGYLMGKYDDRIMKLTQVKSSKSADLVVVDEVSMLTNEVFETLLQSNAKKILLVGDLLQLPAIGNVVNLSKYKTLYLTSNIRQSNSDVSKFMEILRDSVSKRKVLNLSKVELPNDIKLYTNHKEFCKAYLDCNNQKRILAYSNKIVDSYNTNINKGISFKVGDLLVLNKPLGKRAKNGDIVEIIDVKDKGDYYMLEVTYEDEKHIIYVFRTNLAETQFFSNITDTNMYWECKDVTFRPKLVYASTIHKAQGDTIDEVFIDLKDIFSQLQRKPTRFNNYNNPITIDEYMKLVYVAISRMKSKAHLFIGDKRTYKELR